MERFLLVLPLTVFLVSVVQGCQLKTPMTPFEMLVSRSISRSLLLGNLAAKTHEIISPQFPDPLCFGPSHIPVNMNIPQFETILQGDFRLISQSKLHGLSSITQNIQNRSVAGGVWIKWYEEWPKLTLEGDSTMELRYQQGHTSHTYSGGGRMSGSVENVFMSLELIINNAVGEKGLTVRSLDLDSGFKNFNINLGQVTEDGQAVDWKKESQEFQENYGGRNDPEVKANLESALSCMMNFIISGCRDLENESCLKTNPNEIVAACFANGVAQAYNNIGSVLNAFLAASDPSCSAATTMNPTTTPSGATKATNPTTTGTTITQASSPSSDDTTTKADVASLKAQVPNIIFMAMSILVYNL